MSERMSFDVHEKNGKVVNALSRLRRVERREWDLKGRMVRMIYKGLLTAYMMYGALA